MQIMLTNDDGVYAYGILALAKALQAQGGIRSTLWRRIASKAERPIRLLF